jgi:hypothetical protein
LTEIEGEPKKRRREQLFSSPKELKDFRQKGSKCVLSVGPIVPLMTYVKLSKRNIQKGRENQEKKRVDYLFFSSCFLDFFSSLRAKVQRNVKAVRTLRREKSSSSSIGYHSRSFNIPLNDVGKSIMSF